MELHSDIKNKLEKFVMINKIPNIIFHGPTGSGKEVL